MVRRHLLIFNIGDPNFRWVGNEDGIAPLPCWNVVDSTGFSILTEEKDLLEEKLWLPTECDVQITANWFYSDTDEQMLKSLDELVGLYYLSVGRGANLLLNIGQGHHPPAPRERERCGPRDSRKRR